MFISSNDSPIKWWGWEELKSSVSFRSYWEEVMESQYLLHSRFYQLLAQYHIFCIINQRNSRSWWMIFFHISWIFDTALFTQCLRCIITIQILNGIKASNHMFGINASSGRNIKFIRLQWVSQSHFLTACSPVIIAILNIFLLPKLSNKMCPAEVK